MASLGRLDNKVALITGASSGIGAGTAVQFSKLGAHVILTGRNEEALKKTALQCQEGSKFTPVVLAGDLTNEEDVQRIVGEAVAVTGRLDILINNAGIYEQGSIETTSLEQFDRVFAINVRSIFHLTMLCVPHLIQVQGGIVNVSSINGDRCFKGDLVYSMSKSALDQMTRCVALELAPKKVRVNSVSPGVIITEVHKRGGMNDEEYQQFLEKQKERHALGRVGTVEEVAKLIAFLASDCASFITGDLVSVDGGRHVMSVNSAGIIAKGTIETTSLDQFDNVFNINVRSMYHVIMLCVPHLVKTKGSIVNVSSVTGVRAFPGVLTYCMSKSAVDQMTRCIALELASKQVRVNAVNPGVIITDVHKRGGMNEEEYEQFLEKSKGTHALGRVGTVDEVASLIAFLASDSASFITGDCVAVDGGRHAMCPR